MLFVSKKLFLLLFPPKLHLLFRNPSRIHLMYGPINVYASVPSLLFVCEPSSPLFSPPHWYLFGYKPLLYLLSCEQQAGHESIWISGPN